MSEAGGKDELRRSTAKDVKTKVLAEKRAHEIVKLLLEENIPEAVFIDALYFITAAHYQDVTEERAIEKFCGYPVCPNRLAVVSKQRYHISNNKVYDVTERKNFCCNRCFKSSNHVKRQISSEPLWLRDRKKMDPVVLDRSTTGSKGEEIKLRHMIQPDEVESSESSIPLRLNDDQSNDRPQDGASDVTRGEYSYFHELMDHESSDNEIVKRDSHVGPNQLQVPTPESETLETRLSSRTRISDKKLEHSKENTGSLLDKILDLLRDWITDRSLVMMQRLPPRGQPNTTPETSSSDAEKRIEEKMNLLNKNLDAVVLGAPSRKSQSEAQVSMSKDDQEIFMERIERFYKGQLYEKRHVKFKNQEEDSERAASVVQLPKVDSRDQAIIRRNILHQKLSKVLRDIVPQLPPTLCSQQLKSLISTFRLTNTNVMVRANELSILGAALLYVLSTYDSNINEVWLATKTTLSILFNRIDMDFNALLESTEKILTQKVSEHTARIDVVAAAK